MSRPEMALAELDAQTAVPLPRRETLSCQFACVNVSNVIGVNLAIAVNAATINSQANALAAAVPRLGPSALTPTRRGCVALAHPPPPSPPHQSTPER